MIEQGILGPTHAGQRTETHACSHGPAHEKL